MKNRILIWIVLAGFCLPALASDPLTGKTVSAGTSAYTLVKSENSIDIYTRWIPVGESRSARQVQVKFTITASVEKALSILLNDREFTVWMKGTHEYRRIQTTDPNHWYSYIRFSIPWPLNDQDCIIRYAVSKHTPSFYEISIDGDPGYLQPVDGVKRISHMTGSWKLVQVAPGRTLVEYTIFSNQPSSFPKWITDPIIQNNMMETMTAFREQADKRTSGPIYYPASRIPYPVSCIPYRISRIADPVSRIAYPVSRIADPASRIPHHVSRISYHFS